MKITPMHRRIAFAAVALLTVFGLGGLVGNYTAEPEVITISEDVPEVCIRAANTGFEMLNAGDRVAEYETKAGELAADLSFSALAADAGLIEDALDPIAKHNAKEDEWRAALDDARSAFIGAANECLNKADAAEAINDR